MRHSLLCPALMGLALVAAPRPADAQPVISIDDVVVSEGDTGTRSATFLVSLSGPAGTTVKVTYATSAVTATADVDYTSKTATLSFAPGVTSKSINVQVRGDLENETEETFHVLLSAPLAASIDDGEGEGRIADDDGGGAVLPTLKLIDATTVEGDVGTSPLNFVLTLSEPATSPVSVRYSTSNDSAQAGADFVSKTGTATFQPGERSMTIPIKVSPDEDAEGPESLLLNLSSPKGATLARPQAAGLIVDDDSGRLVIVAVGVRDKVVSMLINGESDRCVIAPGGQCRYEGLPFGAQVQIGFPDEDPLLEFQGWSGSCSGFEECIVTINGPEEVTLNFLQY